MDNNLTGLVAINVTQTGLLPYFIALMGPLSALFGGLVALTVSWLTQRKEKRKIKKEKQKEVFRKLKGIRILMSQNYIYFYTIGLNSLRQQAFARLSTEEKNQLIYIDEAKRYAATSKDFLRVFTKDLQELHELIGSIQLYFPDTEELNKKIIPINGQFISFESEFSDSNLKKELNILVPYITNDITTWQNTFDRTRATEYFKKIDDWRDTKAKKLNILVKAIVIQQLDDLLDDLLTTIRTEDKE